MCGFVVGYDLYVGGDVGVVEQVVGKLDDCFDYVFFDQVVVDVVFIVICIIGEEG